MNGFDDDFFDGSLAFGNDPEVNNGYMDDTFVQSLLKSGNVDEVVRFLTEGCSTDVQPEYQETKDGKWEKVEDGLDESIDNQELNSMCERLQKQDEQIREQKEKFVKTIYLGTDDSSFALEYNWDNIDEFLWRKPDDISDIEYLAFVDMLSEMNVSSINELFSNHAYHGHVEELDFGYVYSPVLKNATDMYMYTAAYEAEMTVFNQDPALNFDKKEVVDNLTKATMLKQCMEQIECRSTVNITEIEDNKDNVYKDYEVIIKNYYPLLPEYNYNYDSYDDDKTLNFTIKKKINVYDCLEDTGHTTKEFTKSSLISFGGNSSNGEKLGNIAITNVRDYAITQTLNMAAEESFLGKWSIPGTLYTLAMSSAQTIKNADVATASINALDKGEQLDALDVQANLTTISGLFRNEIEVSNEHFNMAELAIRVGAYNTMYKDEPITVDELITSLEKGDLTLVDKYTEWYYKVGKKDCIVEYRKDLQNFVNNFANINNIKIDVALESLSYAQIMELIHKLDDMDYEMNKELWGIE